MNQMAEPTGGDLPDVPIGDILGEIPLFREIQRVLLASPGPVNWELARQVGIAVASWGAEDQQPTQEDLAGFMQTVRAAELELKEFTGISSPYEPPNNPELVLDTHQLSLAQCVAHILEHLHVGFEDSQVSI